MIAGGFIGHLLLGLSLSYLLSKDLVFSIKGLFLVFYSFHVIHEMLRFLIRNGPVRLSLKSRIVPCLIIALLLLAGDRLLRFGGKVLHLTGEALEGTLLIIVQSVDSISLFLCTTKQV